MTNIIAYLRRTLRRASLTRQFQSAVKSGNTRMAEQLLQQIQNSGAKLSWLEKLFRDKLQSERALNQYKREAATLSGQLKQSSQKILELEQKEKSSQPAEFLLYPHKEFIQFISTSFKLIAHDDNHLQCTGIHQSLFDDFDANLVEYLSEEFSKISAERLAVELQDAIEDINGLKSGKDPEYSFSLSPHVYLMRYFLENVYCTYLAWFLIYQDGLMPTKVNILDIAAGPGTVAYGLALLLESISVFLTMPQMHVSYYSLEKQPAFQYRGLQFWRRYIETRQTSTNAYFRFDTSDILTWEEKSSKLPKNFYDFIVISHCFFYEPVTRQQAHNTYKQIFLNSLKPEGYVLLIVQDKKLFKMHDMRQTEDRDREKKLIKKFVSELGLELVWYRYLTSRESREPVSPAEFAQLARQLPKQVYMTPLVQKHFGIKHDSNYTLDDYVILAKLA